METNPVLVIRVHTENWKDLSLCISFVPYDENLIGVSLADLLQENKEYQNELANSTFHKYALCKTLSVLRIKCANK